MSAISKHNFLYKFPLNGIRLNITSWWLLMNRKVYLMDLCLALALTMFSPKGSSGHVSNPENWSRYLEEDNEHAYRQINRQTDR